MIHFKCSHFILKILQAQSPKMELLWRKVCGIILGKKKILKHSFLKTGHLLQDIFLICTGRLCQVIEELYLWLWPEIFLPPHYSIHVSITHQEAFQAEELIARSGSGCPPCFRLGREFPPGFCLMCFHLLQFCGHAWFIEKNLHFKLFPSPCTRLEH